MIVDNLVLFRTIFEQSPVSTQIFSATGEVVLVNHAWEDLWQKSFSDLKSYNLLTDKQLINQGLMPIVEKACAGQIGHFPIQEQLVESKSHPPLKKKRWLEGVIYPIADENGKLHYIVLQHRDVTEQYEAEIIRYRLAAIVENSSDAIVGKTLDGIITNWNRGAEKLFGYTAEEAIGQSITIIIPPELIDEEKQIIGRLRKGQPTEGLETTRMRKDGSRVVISVTISPIKDQRGVIVGASKIARNITEQRASQTALQESEERLRLALGAGNIGVWDWNLLTGELTWTDRVYTIHGVKKEHFEVNLENFRQLIHPEDKDEVQLTITNSLRDHKPFKAEFRIVTPEGEERWVTTQAAATYDKEGQPTRLLGATSDITKQKKLEQEKNDFLSLAAHELKTPLTSMKLFIELLNKEMDPIQLEKPKYFVKRISDQSQRLTELTADLLDISRIDTGKLGFSYEPFRLDELVAETVESFELLSEDHTFELHCDEPITMIGDRYRIYQVLVNLLTNAVKYSAGNKLIVIRCQNDGNFAMVSVQDFGIGIHDDHQEKIFQRLYQITDTERRTYPGLGLGLYISKEIIERHHGQIKVESQKGHGATFTFTLPIHLDESEVALGRL